MRLKRCIMRLIILGVYTDDSLLDPATEGIIFISDVIAEYRAGNITSDIFVAIYVGLDQVCPIIIFCYFRPAPFPPTFTPNPILQTKYSDSHISQTR